MKIPSDSPHDLLQHKLELEIDKEIEKKARVLKNVQEIYGRLKDEDRELHARGVGASGSEVESIDAQIDSVRHQIEEEEFRLVAAEQLYAKTRGERESVGGFLVGLTEAELENLEGLSHSYQAFAPHLAAGFEASAADKKEACAWSACWTCSGVCGGCSGCGQACSQLNACIGRHE